jgi:hypothetical protein
VNENVSHCARSTPDDIRDVDISSADEILHINSAVREVNRKSIFNILHYLDGYKLIINSRRQSLSDVCIVMSFIPRLEVETVGLCQFANWCCVDVQWQGQSCCLVLHYENGFTLVDLSRGGGALSTKPAIVWSHPFEKLRMSADDGSRLVWLDFGEDGEQVSGKIDLIYYFPNVGGSPFQISVHALRLETFIAVKIVSKCCYKCSCCLAVVFVGVYTFLQVLRRRGLRRTC